MDDSYVCSGATMKCIFGTSEAKLTVFPSRTVFLTGQPQANISDHLPLANIAPFGKCRTTSYPPTAAATAAAHGKLTPMPCVPGTSNPWLGGKNDVLIKGQPALLKSSYCRCIYGGIITITDDGQTNLLCIDSSRIPPVIYEKEISDILLANYLCSLYPKGFPISNSVAETHGLMSNLLSAVYNKDDDNSEEEKEKIIEKKEDKTVISELSYMLLASQKVENRNDCRVFIPESIKGIIKSDGRYYITQNWKPGTDGAVKGSRRMQVIKKGTIVDRVGSPGGNYLSPFNKGMPYTIDERATGDRLISSDITQNTCYHKYVVVQDLKRINIEKAIYITYKRKKAQVMAKRLEAYYRDSLTRGGKHKGETYGKKGSNDGIQMGTIDKMFTDNDGGGVQFIMPFTIREMVEMGLLKEI